MPQTDPKEQLSAGLETNLPALRRYARALTGNQSIGDQHALRALETVLAAPDAVRRATSIRVGLFRVFFQVWNADPGNDGAAENDHATMAQSRLRVLTPQSRQALLLHAIEEFTATEIAEIMDLTTDVVEQLIATARHDMKQSVTGRIMIIEDEAMIAMDLQDIVENMGHHLAGGATTHMQAVTLAEMRKPDLILSDIQLADGSSGIDAVRDILLAAGQTPVIFITAFPERLLTGDRPEPAFLITKPYSVEQVQSAISQAMFFRSSADIAG